MLKFLFRNNFSYFNEPKSVEDNKKMVNFALLNRSHTKFHISAMRRILIIMFAFFTMAAALAAPPRWENVDAPSRQSGVEQRIDAETPDVAVSDGYIYVATARPVTVKVFTILGQLVSNEAVPAGVSRLKLNAKGIYILKIGSLTRRVTI